MTEKYRINGFDQIKAFYSMVFNNEFEFTPQHISLYVFLINQNNRNNWVEWFKCPFDLGMAGSCIGSKSTYYKCLSDLEKWGIIKYKKGINEWKAPLIKIEVLKRTATNTATVPLPEPLPVPLPEPLEGIYINNKPITINHKQVTNKNFNLLKQIFMDFYYKITEHEYYFEAKDGKAVKEIEKKLLYSYKSKGNSNPTEKQIKDGFIYILNLAKSDKWINDNFSLSIINSKYNEIINKNNGSKNSAIDSVINKQLGKL